MRSLGHPHLLERRPVVRGALASEQVSAVSALEPEIHLQSAVVRRARIRPSPLEAVDAEPLTLVRRVLGTASRLRRNAPPHSDLVRRVKGWMLEPPRQRSPHDELPSPRLMTIGIDEPLDLTLRDLQPSRRRTVCGRLAGWRARVGAQLGCADQCRNEGADARRYECQLVPQLDDPLGSTSPRDCAAVEDDWLSVGQTPDLLSS
jgi:hypothetical protein